MTKEISIEDENFTKFVKDIKTKKDKLKLRDRTYICHECGCVIDRDENAALNILKEGQRIFNSTVGNTESLGQYPSKPIATGLNTNLESELLSNPSIEGPLL